MSLASRARDLLMWSSFFAIIMIILAITSMVTMISYLRDGSVEAWISVGGCMVGMFILLVLLCVTTIPLALRIAKESGSKQSLSALYIYILLPLVFIGVMVGNSANYFLNVMIFGWPIFLVSGALMVIAANWINSEARMLSFSVKCGFCSVEFDMMQDELFAHCVNCGAANWNPLKPKDRAEIERVVKAYEPAKSIALGDFNRRARNLQMDPPVFLMIFLAIASCLAFIGGLFLLVESWDWQSGALGLATLLVGVFGMVASYRVMGNNDSILPVLASTILMALSFVTLIIFEVCGVVLGTLSMISFFLSYDLWMLRKKGRKIRVPLGTVIDEAHVPPKHR
jgi:MFS family permease